MHLFLNSGDIYALLAAMCWSSGIILFELSGKVLESLQINFIKNFIGFIEPNKITSGYCDIMISDGYTGNIMIKAAEGMSDFIISNLKKVFVKSFTNKIAYKILENDFKNFRDQINPEKYNGAILIGLNGISVKSHGNATPYAFSCALSKCYDFIVNDLNKKIVETFNNL